MPTLAALRMQRWALVLMSYNYDIEYRKSADHMNADAMSRLPTMGKDCIGEDGSVFYFSQVDELPVSARDIVPRKDPTLCKVWNYTLNGWPNYVLEEGLKPYFTRRHELSEDQGCVLRGMRVIIPPKYGLRLLDELHHEHPGICRMKALARSYLWWPGLDGCTEERVRTCSYCLAVQKSPAVAPLEP